MKKRAKNKDENLLDFIPVKSEKITWETEGEEVVLLIENRGFFHKIAQVCFKKPKISHVHLDKCGSFLWPLIDGEKTIFELGVPFKEHFGEEAEPLYERLSQYFSILKSYNFIRWKHET